MENKILRPTTAKIKGIRPTTGRPQTGIPKKVEKINITDSESVNKIINESQSDENQSKSSKSIQSYSNNSNISNEKINFLEALTNGNQKKTFENIIKEEADRIDMINKQKKNLKNINLIEKNIEGLYDWKTLFNHSRPISSYTKYNPKNMEILDNKKEEEKKEDKFKFPVVLVDIQENQMNMYFNDNINGNTSNKKKLMKQQLEHMQRMNKMKMNGRKTNLNTNSSNISHKKSISNNNSFQRSAIKNKSIRSVRSASASTSRFNKKKPIEGNCVRPMSVYTRRNPKETFYFSQTFSDYYKEDLKDFVKKMPLLRAKISAKPNKLQNTLINSEKKSLLKEEKLKETIANDDLLLSKQEVIIAGRGGNAQPLLKSIYKQIHPEDEVEKNNMKMYYNTMKPLGNNNHRTDFTINDREYHLRQLVEMRNGDFNEYNNKKKSKDDFNNIGNFRDLKLETYDEKDPDLQIFNQIKEVNEDEYEEENEKNLNEKNLNEKDNQIFSKTFSSRNDNNILTTNNTTKLKNLPSSSSQQQQLLSSNNTEIISTNSNLPLMHNQQQQTNLIRPKTSVPTFKKNFIPGKRPFSSRPNQMNNAMNQTPFNSNTLYDNFPSVPSGNDNNNSFDSNYIVTKSFPLHVNSNVGNVTYNKINKRLLSKKESKEYFDNSPPQIITAEMIKNNNFSPNNIKEINKSIANRPLTSNINRKIVSNKLNTINTGTNTVNKWEFKNMEENIPKKKVNYYYFNDYIDTIFKDNTFAEKKRMNYIENEKGYYYPMNCFNKLAGKIYSCSNNSHVKTKRIKKNNMINTLSLEPNQDYNEELIKKRKRIYSAI